MFKDFALQIGTRFVFGRDAECKVGMELAALGVGKALIHHDGSRYLGDTGLLPAIRNSLVAAGIGYVELAGVQPTPRLSLVYEGIELAKDFGATESHKYVNGILDEVAKQHRQIERNH